MPDPRARTSARDDGDPSRAEVRRSRVALVAEWIAVSLGAIGLAVALTWPVALHMGDRIFGYPGDSTGTIAGLWELAHNGGFHLLGSHQNTLTGAPFGWQQGNGINVTSALVFYPAYLTATIGQEVAGYNLVILSGLALSALAMYALVRRLGMSVLVAAWAGLVYTVFPWHLEKAQGHATFVHLEGFPLLVLAALAWHRRPDIRCALLLAGAVGVLWTTAGYFGIIGSVALVTLLAVAAVIDRQRLGTVAALQRFALGFLPSAAVILLVYAISHLGTGYAGVSVARGVGELQPYGSHYWEFVVPSWRNIVFGDWVRPWLGQRLHGSNFSETSLYVGWLTLIFATAWVAWAIVRRGLLSREQSFATAALVALVIVGGACSLPSPLPHTQVPTPSRLIWEVAPQFRVPSRFIVLVMTGLVPLAAYSLEAVCSRVVRARAFRRAAPLVAAFVCVVAGTISYFELSFVPPVPTTKVGTPPPEYAILRSAPRGNLAEYPLVSADQAVNSDYLFWQRLHRRPLLNGAPPGTLPDAVRATLVDPATAGTAAGLAALRVSAIITRPTTYHFSGGSGVPRPGRGYELVGHAPDGASVWRVVARPAPVIAAFRVGFGPPEMPPGTPTSRWLVEPVGRIDLIAEHAGSYLAQFRIVSYGVPRTVRLVGQGPPVTFSVAGSRRVAVPLRIPAGRSSLSISTSPGDQPIPGGRSVSVYVQNWNFRPLAKSSSYPRALLQTVAGP